MTGVDRDLEGIWVLFQQRLLASSQVVCILGHVLRSNDKLWFFIRIRIRPEVTRPRELEMGWNTQPLTGKRWNRSIGITLFLGSNTRQVALQFGCFISRHFCPRRLRQSKTQTNSDHCSTKNINRHRKSPVPVLLQVVFDVEGDEVSIGQRTFHRVWRTEESVVRQPDFKVAQVFELGADAGARITIAAKPEGPH